MRVVIGISSSTFTYRGACSQLFMIISFPELIRVIGTMTPTRLIPTSFPPRAGEGGRRKEEGRRMEGGGRILGSLLPYAANLGGYQLFGDRNWKKDDWPDEGSVG
jgi:hypothetical protein